MSRERNISLASILALVGLLTLVEARAQQARLTEQVRAAKDIHQLESRTKPNFLPEWPGEASTAPATTSTGEPVKEVHAPAGTISEAVRPRSALLTGALTLPSLAKLTLLDKAYLDAFSILREDNECSRFYGGPRAIEVLNQLKLQLRLTYLDRAIALRMTGHTSFTTNYESGVAYRLFEKAELNVNGPFFRRNVFPFDISIPRIGEFSANTREARVTILLHEMGHLIQISANRFLLPNDGGDFALSKENTMRVLEVCRKQIKEQSRIRFERALESVQPGSNTNTSDVSSTAEASGASWSMSGAVSPHLLRQFGNQASARCESCSLEIQIPQDR